MRNKRLARRASLLLISLTEFAACTPQKTLCAGLGPKELASADPTVDVGPASVAGRPKASRGAERSEIPSGKKASPFDPTSQRISPYSALAAVPKTMTGPAMTNIFAAVPVTIPSGCVKIDIQFFRNFFSCLQSGPLIVLACRYKCKPARSTHIYLNLS